MAITVPKPETVTEVVDRIVAKVQHDLWKVNQQIWSNPETAYQEHKAHDTLCDFLEAQGFKVTRHAYGLETAFEATSGSGGRLVNFNAEYDALPGIGHACGHNLIATSSLTAFVALSHVLRTLQIPGRTQLLGTPAEEGGGGKVKLIQAGAYKNVDASLMAHGGPSGLVPPEQNVASIAGVRMVAREQIFVEFHGKAAHAGGNPWDGINALDAFVAAYNNVSILRQQIRDTDRIHAAILDAPKVANVIPGYTKAVFVARSETLTSLKSLSSRLINCIKAGALATGCEVVLETEDYYADILLNNPLCDRYRDIMVKEYNQPALSSIPQVLTGSTDQGNVSYEVPTLHSMFTIPTPQNPKTSIHHPSFTQAAGTKEAFEAALTVGKTLAILGFDVISDDAFYDSVRQDWVDVKMKAKRDQESGVDGNGTGDGRCSKIIGGCC